MNYSKLRLIGIISIASIIFSLSAYGATPSPKRTAPPVAQNQPTKPASLEPTEEARFISLLEQVLPSVVSIVGSRKDIDGQRQVVAQGSGFVVDRNGLILTNQHVVSDATLSYTVYFANEQKYAAAVVSRDPLRDLALLKITSVGYPALTMGDSDKVKIGQTAIAIGNSLGRYPNTVTRGIVSGLGRALTATDNITGKQEALDDVIQTDAAINPGNSGGPLLNSRGEVIGINTAIEERGRGVGFAIPINEGRFMVESFLQNGRVVRPFIGVRFQMVTIDLQDEKSLPYNYGAYLTPGPNPNEPAVVPNSPADRAGLKVGDIILSVNGVSVNGGSTLAKIVRGFKPGRTITLRVARGSTEFTVDLTLAEVPVNGP